MKRPFRRKRLDRFLRGEIDWDGLLGFGHEDREELLFEAKRRLDDGEIDAAERLFLTAMTACVGNRPEVFMGLGACAQARGDISTAMSRYDVVLGLRPDDPHLLANLAECSLLMGDRDAARAALSRIDPGARANLPAALRERIVSLDRLASEAVPIEPAAPGFEITYASEKNLTGAEFRSVLARSTLAERRPMDEPGTIENMLARAGVIVTARDRGLLVGVSRAITDHVYCTYLSDLAVDRAYQRRGIGRELIRRTHVEAGLGTTLILLAAPAAREYYPHIGMQAHDSCWIIPRTPPPADGTPP